MGEGEGGMIREKGIETCKLSYMKQIASPGSMHDTGSLGRINTKIRLIILFTAEDGDALHSQQNQDQELTVVQIVNFLL